MHALDTRGCVTVAARTADARHGRHSAGRGGGSVCARGQGDGASRSTLVPADVRTTRATYGGGYCVGWGGGRGLEAIWLGLIIGGDCNSAMKMLVMMIMLIVIVAMKMIDIIIIYVLILQYYK